MKVIYGGLVMASGGVDLSLWLLFAFVVCFYAPFEFALIPESNNKFKGLIHWIYYLCRWQIWFIQQRKHKDGTGVNLSITLVIDI